MLGSGTQSRHLIVVGALVIIVAVLWLERSRLEHDFFSQFPPSNFGFSSTTQIAVQCRKNCTNALARGAIHALIDPFKTNQTPALDLHIPYRAMQTLLADQQASIARGRAAASRRWVRGIIIHDGQRYRARFRLKGLLADHWSTPGRMSLRVEVSDGKTILGFASFSLHQPSSRQHPYEPAYSLLLQRTGALAATHVYADVSINGEDWGRLNIEERISTPFLEKLRRKDGLVFELSQDRYWEYVTDAGQDAYRAQHYRLRDPLLFADAYGKKKVRQSFAGRQQYSLILNSLLDAGQTELFNAPAMTRSLVFALLWGTNHALMGANTRYYLNPYTLQLQPISSDQSWPQLIENHLLVYPYPEPFRRLIAQASFDGHFKRELDVVGNAVQSLPAAFEKLSRVFPNDDHTPPYAAVARNLRIATNGSTELVREIVAKLPSQRHNYLPDAEPERRPTEKELNSLRYHVHARHYTDGTLKIFNLLPMPVTVTGIRTSYEELGIELSQIPPKGEVEVQTGWSGPQDDDIFVDTEVQGSLASYQTSLSLIPSERTLNPLRAFTSTSSLPTFVIGNADGYRIPTGSWTLEEPLVLDGPLDIASGTSIRFAPTAYIIVHGSLSATGSPQAPIHLGPLRGHWKGIYVLNASNSSNWRHVRVEATTALTRGPLVLTGGVTFYRSDVDFQDVTFAETLAEDALNVVESNANLRSVTVTATRSDAFDFDYCTGTLNDIRLSHVGGDGVDFSGSNMQVNKVDAQHIQDKAFSVGEASVVELSDLSLGNVGVGVAVKDGSTANTRNLQIQGIKLHAAMSYRKKSFYGVATLNINGISSDTLLTYARQIGHTLNVDGKASTEVKLDVDALYSTGIMKKQ